MAKNKKRSKKVRKRYKCIGVTCQICLYIANGCIWLVAFFSAGFGIIIGLSTNTIGVGSDFDALDFLITTPATLFTIYGIALLSVAFVGCFAAVSAYSCTNIVYCILIFVFVALDIFLGIRLSFRPNAYNKFIGNLNDSLNSYGAENAKRVGIIPLPPTLYWDHFQRKGKCCGLHDFIDWKNTTFGKAKYSLPDSCCNEEYNYRGCGYLGWKHPDHGSHTIASVINYRSCLSIFPLAIQEDKDRRLDWVGKGIFAILIFCIIFSLVLICLVSRKRFKPALGLTNPSFLEAPEDPALLEESSGGGGGGGRRVHPEGYGDGDGSGCRRKRVRFDCGPRIIRQEYEPVDEC